jgi:excisionase family DNA binding protein
VSRYLTLEQAAELLALSPYTTRTKAAAGEIPHRRLSGMRRLLFVEAELVAWLDGAALEKVPAPNGGRVVRPRP